MRWIFLVHALAQELGLLVRLAPAQEHWEQEDAPSLLLDDVELPVWTQE
eukprot:CAMPEP_0179179922 /NCGR_PEP_ID=MMETSP0796-20121207/89052_1 /TAXON_ID=73915 /ORGANISM="Pyrodinium bahamense, Strain pbaha01" /LENGTH=48 /DNA_ID= /DNA_START= /DNA_END= /DNA_ORIENTATION=